MPKAHRARRTKRSHKRWSDEEIAQLIPEIRWRRENNYSLKRTARVAKKKVPGRSTDSVISFIARYEGGEFGGPPEYIKNRQAQLEERNEEARIRAEIEQSLAKGERAIEASAAPKTERMILAVGRHNGNAGKNVLYVDRRVLNNFLATSKEVEDFDFHYVGEKLSLRKESVTRYVIAN